MTGGRLLILDREPRCWHAITLDAVIAGDEDDVTGEFAAVAWGEPGFELSAERLADLGAPRVASTRDDVVATARALGLAAHRVPALDPALVRRALADDGELLAVPAGTVDLTTGVVWADPLAHLTDAEQRILRLLVERGAPVAREILGREVLGHGPHAVSRAVDAAVARLRRKIGAEAIVTAYGRGYRFAPATPRAPAPTSPPRPTRSLRLGGALVDLDRRIAEIGGVQRALTEQNVLLVELLEAARPARVERRAIARALGIGERAVTDAVRRLRGKLETDPLQPAIVVACPGGYRLGTEPVNAPIAAVTAGSAARARWVARLCSEALDARGELPPLPDLAELTWAHTALEPTDADAAGVVAAAIALLIELPPALRLTWITRAQHRPPVSRRALLWVARAAAELALLRPDDAERSALEGCRTEPAVASAFTTAHLLASMRGDAEAALARLDEAEARFGADKPMSRAAIARERAWWALRCGDPAAAQQIALDALAALAVGVRQPGHRLGPRNRGVVETHGHLVQVLAVALLRLGHLADALEAADEAVTELARLPRRAQARMARLTRSEVLAALSRLIEARAEVDAVRACAERDGHTEHVALAEAHQIALMWAAGDRDGARAQIATRGPAIRATRQPDAIALLDRLAREDLAAMMSRCSRHPAVLGIASVPPPVP